MKIAVVTDNGVTISRHFGKAAYYLIFTMDGGQIVQKEQVEKVTHRHGSNEVHLHDSEPHGLGAASGHNHGAMLEPVLDCTAVIAGGMGYGAYNAIEQAHLRPVITDLDDPERAVLAYLDGSLVNHTERLH